MFNLRKNFTKSFKASLLSRVIKSRPYSPLDPYGFPISMNSSIDHIIPISFFNKNLIREIQEGKPLELFYKYKKAANSFENLQLLELGVNNKLQDSLEGKKTRCLEIPELIEFLNRKYGLRLKE